MNYTRDLLTATNDLHVSWKDILGNEFNKPYMKNLFSFLLSEIDKDKIIYPPISNWFEALKRTSFKEVSVVILGQDPYHGEGQAHGLSFSVKPKLQFLLHYEIYSKNSLKIQKYQNQAMVV